MSYNPDQLIKISANFIKLTEDFLVEAAKKKEKSKKDKSTSSDKKKDKSDTASAKDNKTTSKDGKTSKDSKDTKKVKKKKSALELTLEKLESRSNSHKKASNYYDRLISKFADDPNMSVEPVLDPNALEYQDGTGERSPLVEQDFWKQNRQKFMQKDPKVVKLQTALNARHFTGADGKPLVVDGIRGKNTNFALQSFKDEFNMPGATDEVAIDQVLNPKDNRQSTYSGTSAPEGNFPS